MSFHIRYRHEGVNYSFNPEGTPPPKYIDALSREAKKIIHKYFDCCAAVRMEKNLEGLIKKSPALFDRFRKNPSERYFMDFLKASINF